MPGAGMGVSKVSYRMKSSEATRGRNGSLRTYLSFLCLLHRRVYMHRTYNSFFPLPSQHGEDKEISP